MSKLSLSDKALFSAIGIKSSFFAKKAIKMGANVNAFNIEGQTNLGLPIIIIIPRIITILNLYQKNLKRHLPNYMKKNVQFVTKNQT
jgi:hypothetical protein